MSKTYGVSIGNSILEVAFRYHNCTPKVGRTIIVRDIHCRYKDYFKITITRINENGHIFADRL